MLEDGSEGSELRGTGEPLRLGGSEGRGGKAAGSSLQMAWPRCLRGLGGDGGGLMLVRCLLRAFSPSG